MTADDWIERGYAARKAGDRDRAIICYGEGAETYRQTGEIQSLASALRHIADMHQETGALERAAPLYDEALTLYRSDPATRSLNLANCIRPMALLAESRGGDALALWREARALYVRAAEETGFDLQPAFDECDRHLSER